MTQPAKGQEPSMEEILASIRRIIADEEPAKIPPDKSPPKDNLLEARDAGPASAMRPATLPPRMITPTPPRPAAPPPRPAPGPAVEDEEEIDSMIARLQATASRLPPAPADKPASDILDLTDEVATPEPAPRVPSTIEGDPDITFEERPSAAPAPAEPSVRPAAARAADEPRRPALLAGERGLISAATTAAVDSAFNTLAQTVLVQNGRTLEDLVREMLRPMLKTWLDDNLPSIVERLVRAEIERVSRGRD